MSRAALAPQDAEKATRTGDTAPRPTWLSRARTALRAHVPDLVIFFIFTAAAGWVTHGLWPDPTSRVLALNPEDQTLYEWFLAYDSRVLFGDFALLSDRLNAPDGVNLMANTTVIALGFLLAPVSVLFGAPVSFALVVTGHLAATAIAWYLLFVRVLGVRRLAAAVGSGFCGFAPGMVSQSNSHLHMTALWLVPVIVWLVVRMARAADPASRPGARGPDWRRLVTSGVALAVTVAVQVFIGEEVLFLTALTLAVMTVAYALARPSYARRVLPGFAVSMLIAVAVASALLAYPLWFQFTGPQSVPNGVFSPYYFSADLASWVAFSPLSLAGSEASAALSTGPAEYNTFLGWPLVVVTVAAVIWLWRHPLAIACAVAALVMATLSLGPRIVINGERTAIPGPYELLVGLPVVESALPMRFALAVIPLIATILALALDRASRLRWRPARILAPVAVAVALVPALPMPLPTETRPPLPTFITGGHWRSCVPPGGVLVPVPPPTPKDPWAMRWATAAHAEFALPEGFFIGPYRPGGRASMGTYKRPTSLLIHDVATGGTRTVSDVERRQAQEDIAFWGASCFVLVDGTPYEDNLRVLMDALLGPGTRIADAWVWRVRD